MTNNGPSRSRWSRAGNEWQFDSEAGKEEVLARRIGGNELGVIRICRDYVRAQKEYASQPHDGKPAGLFAQRFRSSPGRQDGLFWGRKRGEKPSPFGELVAAAIEEGYDPNKPDASPFRGYRFRILTAQGPAAPGGQKSYVVNGDMTGGFALLAYPGQIRIQRRHDLHGRPGWRRLPKGSRQGHRDSGPPLGGVQPGRVVDSRPVAA